MGKVIPFKLRENKVVEPRVIGHRISFYTDEEIDITLLSLNMFGFAEKRYTLEVLRGLDPLYIRSCLCKLRSSNLISSLARRTISMIIDNMEEIRDANV